jgi:MoaA/NifB/PqqE/SkfB family radical SAM enzyme
MDSGLHISIQLTESCDLACRHCCTSSSPKVSTTLDPAYVLDILQQAKALDTSASALFTGGEVFYVRDLLYYAIACARELNLPYSINTNGSWTVDPAERIEVLRSILDIKRLTFSTDAYHKTAVPMGALGQTLREALDLGINTEIHYTYIQGDNFEDILAELDLTEPDLRARVDFSGVMPIGRGVHLDPSVFPEFEKREPCVAASTIMVRSTGAIFGCCGNSLYVPGQHDLRHGHVRATQLKDIVNARQTNLVLQAIRTVGARSLAEAAGVIDDNAMDQLMSKSPCGSCGLLLRERNKYKTRAAAERFQDQAQTLRALYYGEI